MSSCLEWAGMVVSAVRDVVGRCDCITLTGGVDSTFLALVHPARSLLRGVTVDLGGSDALYAMMVSQQLLIGVHEIIKPSEVDVWEALDWVLGNLKTIDPVEVSADIVHYMTARWALERGCRCLLTGDGGDEVFLGYTFLENMSLEELREWHEWVIREARLPTVQVGSILGVKVVTPLYLPEVREISRVVPVDCMLRRGLGGKILLRSYLEANGLRDIAWRPKTPVNIGSGSLKMLKELASKTYVDEEEVAGSLGFKPPTRLHAFLALRMLKLKIEIPERVEEGCPICGRKLNGRTCFFCGSYIARDGVILHYTGD